MKPKLKLTICGIILTIMLIKNCNVYIWIYWEFNIIY